MEYKVIRTEDYLAHHGILGQKWGVRRFQNEDGTLTPEGRERYGADERRSVGEKRYYIKGTIPKDNTAGMVQKKKGLTEKQKKALKTGAIVTGSILAAYGGYQLYRVIKNSEKDLDPEFKFPLLKHAETTEECLKTINPGLANINGRPTAIVRGSACNCMNCTTAYELRKRGYDVRAKVSNDGYLADEYFSKLYKNYEKVNNVYSIKYNRDKINIEKTYSSLVETLKKEGPGARGNILVAWDPSIMIGSHSMIWENQDGVIRFMDGQTGSEYKNFSEEILKNASIIMPIQYLRTDNLDIDAEMIHKFVTGGTHKEYISNLVAKEATKYALTGTGIITAAKLLKGEKNDTQRSKNKNRK